MKRIVVIAAIISLCVAVSVNAADKNLRLGFLSAEEKLEPVAEGAYGLAEENYNTTLLIVEQGGEFSDSKANIHELSEFAVLWWHYSVSGTIPASFNDEKTKNAIRGYIESGGTMFLTAVALHYVFDLGIEPGEPRVFGPLGKPGRGVQPVETNHPIFEGFNTSQLITLSDIDQPGSTSDFWNLAAGPIGTVLAKTGNERQLAEYIVGKGKIIVLGHHSPVYTDGGSENLKKLTINIIEHLASVSMFGAPVEPLGKLAMPWAGIKTKVGR
jgi:hypothetical protein